MFTNSEHISGASHLPADPRALFDIAATRRAEYMATPVAGVRSLMQHAGLAVARLALALAPHARTIWIACGPGNNGGDGLEAAFHLHRWGKDVVVSELPDNPTRAGNALASQQRAIAAGLPMGTIAPAQFDFCIDALYGIGKCNGIDGLCLDWMARMNTSPAGVLAVDCPTGLNADTGAALSQVVRASATLSLLTLKPGLFTADGRACCGDIWLNTLNVALGQNPCASLGGTPALHARPHNTHKGSYGDVAVIGGDAGMLGAAVLAARAALVGGAGRVYLGLLADQGMTWDDQQPELMVRPVATLAMETLTVVAGCGGGQAIANCLVDTVLRARSLVLDADALNQLALSLDVQSKLAQRPSGTTVLTPHPLEAARLLATSVGAVQSHRLQAAQTLADRWQCTVVLKGSGTVIAAPHRVPVINPTGNARLATAGTGDVLAGLIGSYLARGQDAFSAACDAVYRHGQCADHWPTGAGALTAHRLTQML